MPWATAEAHRQYDRTYYARNRDQVRLKQRLHYTTNQKAMRVINNRSLLKSRHGLELEEKMMLQAAQTGRCAICTDAGDCVDHDHVTGRTRAMLCRKCNFSLGLMDDSPALLRAAADYLEYYA